MMIPREKLIEMYASLVRIRKIELKIEELYHEDEMKTPVHLSLGQEAAAVGVCAHLNRDDYVFSNHRSHAHYLAKGGDVKAMIAELYNKETGCAKGRGGSMHLIDTSIGHLGSSSIVGGSIPHAVGAAYAAVMQKTNRVAVSFFGDAASEQGVFYESMSWAALKKLPVVFVCENNSYSVCSHISARQANNNISMRSRAFDIPSQRVDGMDLLEVYAKAGEAIAHARGGSGPYLLECVVQRWRGHAGAGDPGAEKYRMPEDLDESKRRDPVQEFKDWMLKEGTAGENELTVIEQDLDREVDSAFRYAQESPLPKKEELEKYLFAE